MTAEILVNWLNVVPQYALPYALAALGLLVMEKAGIQSLGSEGFMLVGAMAAVGWQISAGGSAAMALAVAAVAGAALSLLYALLVVPLRVNQVIAGLGIVYFAQGLTGLVGSLAGWTNKPVPGLHDLALGRLDSLPWLGPILFRHDALVWLAVPIFALAAWIMARTMVGLRVRAVGDGPDAADVAGVSVPLQRIGAIAVGAALVGLAGGYLSIGIARIWTDGMTDGRGWIAIALVIFARWQPWRALGGAILFGAIEAMLPRLAAAGVRIPQYLVAMAPYLTTLAVMAWTGARSGGISLEPRALGRPHLRSDR